MLNFNPSKIYFSFYQCSKYFCNFKNYCSIPWLSSCKCEHCQYCYEKFPGFKRPTLVIKKEKREDQNCKTHTTNITESNNKNLMFKLWKLLKQKMMGCCFSVCGKKKIKEFPHSPIKSFKAYNFIDNYSLQIIRT